MNKAEELIVEKLVELGREIVRLQTENDCIKKENEFLKTLINKTNESINRKLQGLGYLL